MGDGLLGMTPDLGSGKETYMQFLKRRGAINSISFCLDYDRAEE